MSEQVFMLPDLGEGLTEAEVVEWLVAVGDEVTIDQNVVTVETAKATVEVPIPFAGTVSALHGEVGQVMEVGRPLISVGGATGSGSSSTGSSSATSSDAGGDPRAGHDQYRTEERAGSTVPAEGGETTDEGSGAVLIGFGTGHGGGARRRRAARGAAGTAASQPAPTQPATEQPAVGAPKVISPLVRRLAAEKGLDLTGITPSAPDGVIPTAPGRGPRG